MMYDGKRSRSTRWWVLSLALSLILKLKGCAMAEPTIVGIEIEIAILIDIEKATTTKELGII